jgi:hypothetical protein
MPINLGTNFDYRGRQFDFERQSVPATGDIDFAAWQEGSPTQQFRPGFNLIELTKLA